MIAAGPSTVLWATMRVRPLGEDITFAPQFRLAIPKLRDARRRSCPAWFVRA
jgi:hypothetical protein